MLTKALQTFKSLCLKTACTFHFKVYALIPLENWQSGVKHQLQATRQNDSLNNVLTCCTLPLFRISDLLVPCTFQFQVCTLVLFKIGHDFYLRFSDHSKPKQTDVIFSRHWSIKGGFHTKIHQSMVLPPVLRKVNNM